MMNCSEGGEKSNQEATSSSRQDVFSDLKHTLAKSKEKIPLQESHRLLLQGMHRGLLYSNECSGRASIPPGNSISVVYRDPNTSVSEEIQFCRGGVELASNASSSSDIGSGAARSTATITALEKLQAACSIQDNEETLILFASEIIEVKGLNNDVLDSIMQDVKVCLFSEHNELTPQLHSLRILPAWSKLKPRTVQPLNEGCIGWLVITLPLAHTGGHTVISTYGNEIKHPNESYLHSLGKISYSAFHLETKYCMKEVLSAARITLVYSLQGDPVLAEVFRRGFRQQDHASPSTSKSINRERYESLQLVSLRELCSLRGISVLGKKADLIERLDAGSSMNTPYSEPNDELHYQWPAMPKSIAMAKTQSFRTQLACLLSSAEFLPAGGKLAFPLFHVYEYEKQLPGDIELANNAFTLHLDGSHSPLLKGADALLLLALRSTRISVQLMRLALFIDGPMMVTTICDSLPDLKSALSTFTSMRLVNKTQYAAAIDGSKLQDDSQLLENVYWTMDQSYTPIALLLEAFQSPTGTYEDCRGTCRLYSKVVALLDISPQGAIDRQHQINLLQVPLSSDIPFEKIRPGAVPQVESLYARSRFEFHTAMQASTAPTVSLEEVKAIAKQHEVDDKGNTKTIIDKINKKLHSSHHTQLK